MGGGKIKRLPRSLRPRELFLRLLLRLIEDAIDVGQVDLTEIDSALQAARDRIRDLQRGSA